MRALVTGAAGFVGSTLVDRLLQDGHDVVGVDCFRDYYDRAAKAANLAGADRHDRFTMVELDLVSGDLDALLIGVDVVFHQAGQPGVRLSWSHGFERYAADNIVGTQRLLEAARSRELQRFVYASSSSVYGNAPRYPTTEDDLPQPHSPYGVTKLAAEHLCGLYAANYGVPTVSLRYFTVYGPRQRPDMAIHRLIEAAIHQDPPFRLFGNGDAVRDFTFVDDIVEANVAAATADVAAGFVCNVAGGASCTVAELIDTVSDAVGQRVPILEQPAEPGDVARTGGTIDLARRAFGWEPRVRLPQGVAQQVAWHRSRVGGTR